MIHSRARKAEFSPGLVRQSAGKELVKRIPLRNIDKLVLLSALILAVMGVVLIYSATHTDDASTYFLKRQLMWLVIALLAMTVGAGFDYHKMMPYAWHIYSGVLALLVIVFFFPEINGAHRWINLGFFPLQPSELAKVGIVIVLATFVADQGMDLSANRPFVTAFVIALVPIGLIFLEPDIGIAACCFAITVGMTMVGGARLKQLAALGVASIISFLLAIQLNVFKSYQLNRLLVFINPDLDRLESGYNLAQSKIAIGSGQLFGRGLFNGTQTNLQFIPEHHTDFIFSVTGEELGFIGASIILALFVVFLWRSLKIAGTARDAFGTMLVTGFVIMFAWQVVVNVGMAMGIMPVTGITLPFLSYGGSSLIVNCFCVGLILNVGMRRFPQGP